MGIENSKKNLPPEKHSLIKTGLHFLNHMLGRYLKHFAQFVLYGA